MRDLKIRAVQAPWRRGIEFQLVQHLSPEKVAVCKSIEMVEVDDDMYVDPSFTIQITEAQVLMDDLWNAGLRPTEGTGSAGSLKATERHLEDMRTLVFDKNRV